LASVDLTNKFATQKFMLNLWVGLPKDLRSFFERKYHIERVRYLERINKFDAKIQKGDSALSATAEELPALA
jgi:hypothetical protein